MFEKPTPAHEWFQPLLGEWEFEHECQSPEGPSKERGRVSARSLGGLWFLLEYHTEGWNSLFTLGYNPLKQRYQGSFVASMMSHLWLYDGQLDESGQLVLDAEGPRFDGKGMARYQDCLEIVSPDHWVLRSRMLGDDGQWVQFMEGHQRRLASS